jgi:hypothetical protein
MDEWLSGGIPLHGRRRNPETKEAMAVRPWSFTARRFYPHFTPLSNGFNTRILYSLLKDAEAYNRKERAYVPMSKLKRQIRNMLQVRI